MKNLTILLVPVGGEPQVAQISDNVDAWHKLIGGYFTMHTIVPGVEVVCADDHHGKAPNSMGLYGPFFFVGLDTRSGNSKSLTPIQLDKCRKYWEARRHEPVPTPAEIEGSIRVVGVDSPEMAAHAKAKREEQEAIRRLWKSL